MEKLAVWKRVPNATEEKTEKFRQFVRETGGKVKITASGWTWPSDGEQLPLAELGEFKVHDLHESKDKNRIWGIGSSPGSNGWRYVQFFTVKRPKGEKDE